MAQRVLSIRNKLTIVFLAFLQLILLGFLANYFQLNAFAKRALERTFDIPQNIFDQIFEEYREFESEKVLLLENDIEDLEEAIYLKDLKIESLENQKSFISPSPRLSIASKVYVSGFRYSDYECCGKHRIFIKSQNFKENETFSVSQGSFAIGKSRIQVFDEFEIALLSDSEEFLSIKNAKGFFCIAKGSGLPKKIICENESKSDFFEIGDTFFTSGFDGVYPEGLIVGSLEEITTLKEVNFKQKLVIQLFFDPYKSMNKEVLIHE
tara:strand:+ start:19259 stop:20056 length:798 start_codon:yes stop_codon:yes gene_type:complete